MKKIVLKTSVQLVYKNRLQFQLTDALKKVKVWVIDIWSAPEESTITVVRLVFGLFSRVVLLATVLHASGSTPGIAPATAILRSRDPMWV